MLSKAMPHYPDAFEVSVFRQFVSKFGRIKKKLAVTYNPDNVLRDRLLIAVDIPIIQTTLRIRIPRSSWEAINRVANQFSHLSGSAGSNAILSVGHKPEEIYYSLENVHSCDAIREENKLCYKSNTSRRRGVYTPNTRLFDLTRWRESRVASSFLTNTWWDNYIMKTNFWLPSTCWWLTTHTPW